MGFRRIATAVLILICVAGLAATLLGAYRVYTYERGILDPLKEDLIRRTGEAAGRIERSLAPAREAAESMARQLDAIEHPGEEKLLELLEAAIETDESC